MAKNITLSVDEEVLKKVRILAAKQDTTVNAIVRAHLEALAGANEDREKRRLEALANLREMSKNSGVKLGKNYKFSREDAYEERLR